MDIKTGLTILSLVVAAVSAFYAARISDEQDMSSIRERLIKLETSPKITEARVSELIAAAQRENEAAVISINDFVPMPSGAVVAFDFDLKTDPGCPQGWAFFEPGGGRVIVGAGDHDNKWFAEGSQEPQRITIYETYAQDARAGIQETHEARATGGAEEVVLTEAQMPEHGHKSLGPDFVVMNRNHPETEVAANTDGSFGRIQYLSQPFEPAGGSKPHANMPPFIALYFCKKT